MSSIKIRLDFRFKLRRATKIDSHWYVKDVHPAQRIWISGGFSEITTSRLTQQFSISLKKNLN